MKKILITGATGQLGSATIEHLLKHTAVENIIALARSEEKAKSLIEKGVNVRFGDFENIASLDAAMQGVDKVLLISTVDHHRFQQHKNVIDAAKKAGVKHILYTSAAIKDINASPVKAHLESHYQTEAYLKESGLSYTIFQNSLYADMIPLYVGAKVFERGIYLPAGNGKVAFALRREIGEAIANALLADGHENKTYQITGSELYSYQDIANELSALSGKTIAYTDADATAFPEQLKAMGIPERMIMVAAGFSADIKNKQYEIITNNLKKLLGRKPADLATALKELYSNVI